MKMEMDIGSASQTHKLRQTDRKMGGGSDEEAPDTERQRQRQRDRERDTEAARQKRHIQRDRQGGNEAGRTTSALACGHASKGEAR